MDCFYAAVRGKVPRLPDRVFDPRWALIKTEMVPGQWARTFRQEHGPGPKQPAHWTQETERAFIEALIDYSVAGLKAPVTQWSHPNFERSAHPPRLI
jgi:hypothetical protein